MTLIVSPLLICLRLSLSFLTLKPIVPMSSKVPIGFVVLFQVVFGVKTLKSFIVFIVPIVPINLVFTIVPLELFFLYRERMTFMMRAISSFASSSSSSRSSQTYHKSLPILKAIHFFAFSLALSISHLASQDLSFPKILCNMIFVFWVLLKSSFVVFPFTHKTIDNDNHIFIVLNLFFSNSQSSKLATQSFKTRLVGGHIFTLLHTKVLELFFASIWCLFFRLEWPICISSTHIQTCASFKNMRFRFQVRVYPEPEPAKGRFLGSGLVSIDQVIKDTITYRGTPSIQLSRREKTSTFGVCPIRFRMV